MKIIKRFLLITFLSVPLFLVPKQSHAGIIGDLLGFLFGNNQGQNGQGQNGNGQNGNGDQRDPSNTVPLDGGTILLVMAGLGLGTVMLLRAKSQTSEVASA